MTFCLPAILARRLQIAFNLPRPTFETREPSLRLIFAHQIPLGTVSTGPAKITSEFLGGTVFAGSAA